MVPVSLPVVIVVFELEAFECKMMVIRKTTTVDGVAITAMH